MTEQSMIQHDRYDAVIVGARCAGAATAMLLARQGVRVLLIDREKELRDTISTHALMRPAVELLADWGLLDQIIQSDTPAVTRTRFTYGSETVDIPIKPSKTVPALFAPRRTVLDNILRNAAVAAGAELHSGTSFEGLSYNKDGRVNAVHLRNSGNARTTISTDIVIGADGLRSNVATAVSAPFLVRSQDRTATVYCYVDGIPNEGYRWYFGHGVAAGLIPTTKGQHCLFGFCKPDAFSARFARDAERGLLDLLSMWEPGIAASLAERLPFDRLRRFPGSAAHIRQCAGPGWALVGDAGYFKDPCTAHGITDAFLDADRLARAYVQNPQDVSSYQAERDHFAHEFLGITQKIASMDWDFETLKEMHKELHACIKSEGLGLTNASSQPRADAA